MLFFQCTLHSPTTYHRRTVSCLAVASYHEHYNHPAYLASGGNNQLYDTIIPEGSASPVHHQTRHAHRKSEGAISLDQLQKGLSGAGVSNVNTSAAEAKENKDGRFFFYFLLPMDAAANCDFSTDNLPHHWKRDRCGLKTRSDLVTEEKREKDKKTWPWVMHYVHAQLTRTIPPLLHIGNAGFCLHKRVRERVRIVCVCILRQ